MCMSGVLAAEPADEPPDEVRSADSASAFCAFRAICWYQRENGPTTVAA